MTLLWDRQDREAVLAALARGERPDMATTLSAGVVDELVALHEELGVLPALGAAPSARERRGVPDPLLLRTLPFVAGCYPCVLLSPKVFDEAPSVDNRISLCYRMS